MLAYRASGADFGFECCPRAARRVSASREDTVVTGLRPIDHVVCVTGRETITLKEERDIEKGYSKAEFAAKLRRLADAVENDKRFAIQIAGERIYVPVRAEFNIEHERSDDEEEIEFQIKWKREG